MPIAALLAPLATASAFFATQLGEQATERAQDTGPSVVWAFANISFAAMRAQQQPASIWRIVAFICGFPGTLLTLLVVEEGSERMYGFGVPRRASSTHELLDQRLAARAG